MFTHIVDHPGNTVFERDLRTNPQYDAIKARDFPSWELGVQMIAPAELDKFEFNPLDATQTWTGVPEMKVGKLTLNKVPTNFFQFTEQVAFSPGMIVPGIESSEDRLLQGRLFSYADTQRYRVGTNYLMLPVNRPLVDVNNGNQGGTMNFGTTNSNVNYEPSVSTGSRRADPRNGVNLAALNKLNLTRPKSMDFKQAGDLYRSFSATEKKNLVKNLAGDLGAVKNVKVKATIVSFFYQADQDYGTRVAEAVGVNIDQVRPLITSSKKSERP